MRIGINPEKEKFQKILYKTHRIIIPVYIPNDVNEYFKDLFQVFKLNIKSILETIDNSSTNISIINNNCKPEVTAFIEELLLDKKIDKHIIYSLNYGKVYAVIQEAKASFEDFITIADADVFFFNDWQNQVYQVFNQFKNVGVVGLTPDPNMAFYCNNSLFFNNFLNIKKGKIVQDYDLELFEEGINNNNLFVTKKYDWKKNQFYIKKNNLKVVVGANHFASTYRKQVFDEINFEKPIFVFPGGELNYLDIPIDKAGFYRVSLTKAFAYHIGNSIKKDLLDYKFESNFCDILDLRKQHVFFRNFKTNYKIKILITRLIRKILIG